MPKHEQFEQLCALEAVGQLSPTERRVLSEHLAECASCRIVYDDYCLILRELPAAERNPDEFVRPIASVEDALKERFWARAENERITVPSEILRHPHGRNRAKVFRLKLAALVAAAAILMIAVGPAVRDRIQRRPGVKALPISAARPANGLKITRQDSGEGSLSHSEGQLLAVIADLERQKANLAGRLAGVERQLRTSLDQKQALERTNAQFADSNARLHEERDQGIKAAADARAELEKVRAERLQLEATMVAQQVSDAELAAKVKAQTANIERERQLLAADRDIRDLMGARSLHIIDVHDADVHGKNKKAFGRAFFTEGKSLIFYAFDLDEKKLTNSSFSYQAWGERNGKPETVKSLGILFADDHAQRRWVLKVNDPNQLEGIDSLFVTLEPPGDRDKPSGHKLLYAFLQTEANHP